jgi:plastocyanin
MQNVRSGYVWGYAATLLLLLAGCAGQKRTVNVATPAEEKVQVQMKASSFHFDPDVIVARQGQTLVLNVTNVSGERHNLTVKDPAGTIMKSQDIPGHASITMEVPLATAGVYPFYCGIDLHTTLGMKGRIEVK